jgi:hypothetical protein
MPVPFHARFLPGLALLDLLAQPCHDLQPDRFQRVVASFGVNVRSGHGQQYKRAKRRGGAPLIFQNDSGSGYGREALQPFD